MTNTPVVVDIGTSRARIGRAGEAIPSFYQPIKPGASCPVWNSRVHDYDSFEAKLAESKQLTSPDDMDVLMIQSVTEPDSLNYRKQLCEILLEKQKVRAINFQYSSVVSCFSNARQTALVLDLAAGGCTASAVLDGWCLLNTNVERSELGGNQLDIWLAGGVKNSLSMTKQELNAVTKQRDARESQTFKLPDSTVISEKVVDVLFDPTSLENSTNFVPLHELAFTAATRQTSNEVRRLLMNNIVLCGGLSRTDGLTLRLANELNAMARMDNPRIISCGLEHRDLVPWIGGSILGSLPIFKEIAVSRAEYEEGGIDVVFKKCA